MTRIVCFLGLLLIAASCAESAEVMAPSRVLVELRYEPNMRAPEAWSAKVLEDGRVTFRTDGDPRRGSQRSGQRLSREAVVAIRQAFRDATFSSLDPNYETSATDQETLTITWTEAGKTVRVYGPQILCNEAGPARFLSVWASIASRVRIPRSLRPSSSYDGCAAN
jgi:hypothetical protein